MNFRAYLASILADYTPEERSTAMFELYKDRIGEWRWRLLANNKRIIADSGESYRKRSECHKAVDRVKALVATAAVIEVLHKPEAED